MGAWISHAVKMERAASNAQEAPSPARRPSDVAMVSALLAIAHAIMALRETLESRR